MDPTMYLTYIIILYVTIGTLVYAKDSCTKSITKKLVNGYVCPTDTKTANFSYIPQHLCTHYCISIFQCSMLSYYVKQSLCLVLKEICVETKQAKEQVFSWIVLYRPPMNECISWLPYRGNIPDGKRFVYRGIYSQHYVARLRYENEILPGKLVKQSIHMTFKTVNPVRGSNAIHQAPDDNVEFLVVSDTCSVTWIPYVAGNQMPPRAVVGGRKSNGGPLFVASLWVTRTDMKSKYSYGYFDTEKQLGYAYYSEALSNSSVDIMVENWFIPCLVGAFPEYDPKTHR